MKQGTRVKVKATGKTGVIFSANEKLANVTIDEHLVAPGDDTQEYHRPEDLEEVVETKSDEQSQNEAANAPENNAGNEIGEKPSPETIEWFKKLADLFNECPVPALKDQLINDNSLEAFLKEVESLK